MPRKAGNNGKLIRVTDELYADIQKRASEQGCSIAECVRRAFAPMREVTDGNLRVGDVIEQTGPVNKKTGGAPARVMRPGSSPWVRKP